MIVLLSSLVLSKSLLSSSPVSSYTLEQGSLRLTISRETGRFDISWGRAAVIAAHGEVRLPDGKFRRTDEYAHHIIEAKHVHDLFGSGTKITIRHQSDDLPELDQTLTVYRGKEELFAQIRLLDPTGRGTNGLAPVVSDSPVSFAHTGPLQPLFVPYDNDAYFRYNSIGWGDGEGSADGSYEVGGIYDDSSRAGLIVGSIDHTLWKSGIRFFKDGGMRVVAGVTSKFTHDIQPHGTVTGKDVASPRFVLGYYSDWRDGLERYGDINKLVSPPLPWKGDVPFGWNSWSGHKDKVTAKDADAATEFVAHKLPWFRTNGTAWINFDSFWDNLTRAQRAAFCVKAHSLGLKAGIYWTPFVSWGELNTKVETTHYMYDDLALRDANGKPLPKLDGGFPLDPTHPGTLDRIDRNLKDFVDQGFDYVKLDFLTHGALEGKHYDPKITTGTAAYAVGMRRILNDLDQKKIGRPFFIGLSIAPMFPTGFGHSRRISCDVFANIGASEYFLNSANYAWWEATRLYQFNDPDSACVYQVLGDPPITEAESRTRFTVSVIGGGMMVESDNLGAAASQERVLSIFSNRELLDLARKTPQFRPVSGTTADQAGDQFVCLNKGGKSGYVAVFNLGKTDRKQMAIPFDRLGLRPGAYTTHELWTGKTSVATGQLTFDLAPMDCAIVRIEAK